MFQHLLTKSTRAIFFQRYDKKFPANALQTTDKNSMFVISLTVGNKLVCVKVRRRLKCQNVKAWNIPGWIYVPVYYILRTQTLPPQEHFCTLPIFPE